MPDSLPPPHPRRAVSQRTEHVITDATTTIAAEDDLRLQALRTDVMDQVKTEVGQVKSEVRQVEIHISEWQGAMMASYELVMKTVQQSATATNEAISLLTKQVEKLSAERSDDANFISAQKAENAAKAHEAELIAARKEERAIIVLEQQKEKDRQDKISRDDREAGLAKRNKILYLLLGTVVTSIAGLTIYIVTAPGNTAGKTLAETVIGALVVAGIALAIFIKPEAGV